MGGDHHFLRKWLVLAESEVSDCLLQACKGKSEGSEPPLQTCNGAL